MLIIVIKVLKLIMMTTFISESISSVNLHLLATCCHNSDVGYIFLDIYDPSSLKMFLCFSSIISIERDMALWLERGALSMSLPAVRFRIPLGAGFSEKYHVSLLSILGHC